MITLAANLIFGSIVALGAFVGAWRYKDSLDVLDRLCLCGLAGTMFLTTPALFLTNTPFDPWAFSLSRAFLAVIIGRRVLWEIRGIMRQDRQRHQSGRVLGDKVRFK